MISVCLREGKDLESNWNNHFDSWIFQVTSVYPKFWAEGEGSSPIRLVNMWDIQHIARPERGYWFRGTINFRKTSVNAGILCREFKKTLLQEHLFVFGAQPPACCSLAHHLVDKYNMEVCQDSKKHPKNGPSFGVLVRKTGTSTNGWNL